MCCVVYAVHLFFPYYLGFYDNSSDCYPLSVLYNFAGIIFFNNLFKLLLDRNIPLLTHIGKNSMVYYITHGTFFYLLFAVHTFPNQGWGLYFISIAITAVFLYLMDILFRSEKLKWLSGEYVPEKKL